MNHSLAQLAEDVEAALELHEQLAERVRAVISDRAGLEFTKSDLDSTDRVLEAILAVKPGWHLILRGTARQPNGHWRCTVRHGSDRDNDEYIGVARGPTLPHALLGALLKTLSFEE